MHFCVVPGCSNDSVSHPNLSFHRLPLKKKSLLKMWMHKIGRKNLPLNSNSRVCSNHFINSTGRNRLRRDEFPTENLPSLPTQVTSVASLKFCLHNKAVCNNLSYYIVFTSVETWNACYEYLGPAVRNLTYWNGGKIRRQR